jgi:hypothetical protein
MQAIQSDQGWIIRHGYYYHLLIRWICLTRFIDGAGIATNLRKQQEKECPKISRRPFFPKYACGNDIVLFFSLVNSQIGDKIKYTP